MREVSLKFDPEVDSLGMNDQSMAERLFDKDPWSEI
jgi:hypothetical protein